MAIGGKPLYGLPEARFERIRLEEGLISFLARPRFWDCRFQTAPRPPHGRTAPKVHWSMWLFFEPSTRPASRLAWCHKPSGCPASCPGGCTAAAWRKKRFLFAQIARRLDLEAEARGVERIGSMEIGTRGARAIWDRVERPYERSKLFEWLLAHHDEFIKAWGGRRMEWRRLCADFAKDGRTDARGNPVNATTARKTWQRVRKEKARIDALRAAERAERERRAAASPRRDMPSQFRKGEYGPPLATGSLTTSPMPKLPATTARQRERGLQLSTAEGVVVTKAGRVFKLEEGGEDFVFDEKGIIRGTENFWSTALRAKQQNNDTGQRPINDGTADMYAKLGLRSEP